MYSYIDTDEMKTGLLKDVPEPIKKLIPDVYKKNSQAMSGESGTLVLWTKLDKVHWKTSKALFNNSEALIGRMYRYFIHQKQVKIRLYAIDASSKSVISDDLAKPNDPLYLMTGTSTPEPYDQKAAFEPFPTRENYIETYPIKFKGKEHQVEIRMSVASKEMRENGGTRNIGGTPIGIHCKKNKGVSVLRAGRELDNFGIWHGSDDRLHRWWGMEIDFPPALDELFGVTNDKQDARNLREVGTRYDFDDEMASDIHSHVAKLEAEEDPIAQIVYLVFIVRKNIDQMFLLVQKQLRKDETKQKRHDPNSDAADLQATDATKQRIVDGKRGESDKDAENNTEEQNKEELQKTLMEDGVTEEEARETVEHVFKIDSKYVIDHSELDSVYMFSVRKAGGKIIVTLNIKHPLYSRLVGILDKADQFNDPSENDTERLEKANVALKVLIYSWARMEDEVTSKQKSELQNVRYNWSNVANEFLQIGGAENE